MNEYGLDYAMYSHDIERIEELSNFNEVNTHMEEDGWVLLAITQFGDTDTFYHSGEPIYNSHPLYTMGVPRPQLCFKGHLKKWEHTKKEWVCLDCSPS